MSYNFTINPNLDIPIYQQLVDEITIAVKKGDFKHGQKLPTVYEMTQQLNVARGTIKRAYDELERSGIIEKVQGRGTFVCYHPTNSGSRKEQAMSAIDDMLSKLEQMGFSNSEINIFLNLKLRERSEEESNIKVAVVECNPEALSQISDQLRSIGGIDLYSYMLESIKEYPYKISEGFDLIVTTSSHAQYLESTLPIKKKILRVALRPSPRCLSHIIKLRAGTRVGIIGYSDRFSELLLKECQDYAEDIRVNEPFIAALDMNISDYLKGKDALLVPRHYNKYFGSEINEKLKKFKGEIIECYYEMDEGSVMYFESKIKRLLEEKTI
ncbi:MAG: GntR family transcriptional regulator [Clostridia bacterium]|nr:GntR family transcriptional regulator [Clostridia bacterium]